MRYLSFRDLQHKLGGRGRTTIYRDVDLGRLPKPVKIGSRLYWNEEGVDSAIEKRAETQAAEAKPTPATRTAPIVENNHGKS